MRLVLMLYMPRLHFDYIVYSIRNISGNYLNWPINKLRNLREFFKHSLIHAPHSEDIKAV